MFFWGGGVRGMPILEGQPKGETSGRDEVELLHVT